jgi:hypothetical protein
MKKKRKFQEGGNVVEPGDGVQYFADDELAAANKRNLRKEIDELNAAQYTGSAPIIDEYSGKETTTRRNLETGDYYSTEPVTRKAEPARAAKKAPPIKDVPGSGRGSMAGRRASDDIMYVTGGGRSRMAGRTASDDTTYVTGGSRGRMSGPGIGEREAYEASRSKSTQIPTASQAGPEKVSSPAMEMSDKERIRNTTIGALGTIGGAAGLAKLMQVRKAKQAAELAQEAAKRFSKPGQARQIGDKTPAKAENVAKKRGEAEAMEKAKPILQSRPSTKAKRADRTRRTEEDSQIEFSKGGSASRRADGCAVRGKTKGKLY